ncbi:tripartite tricarboxylate transporter TctB family protein [Luteitalea sp. TBR-22]|uniref:tripartite tricarboxylate transporter TctB family protein n=1 Tax=Luteitalea sp. TBR-22 TaxID=2802971 RepID=UPI001EF69327|nr:tripartite tricarboxylate transporter TctB family protein [Luteitalea sp. TBR-22]
MRQQELRSLLAVTGSVVAFALTVERVGLLAAVIATTLLASVGAGRLPVRVALPYAAALAIAVGLLFVGGLSLPIPLMPWP